MFDTLVESTSHRRSARTWLYFAVSSAVWVVILTGVAVAGIMTYDESLNADFQNLALVAVVKVSPPPARAPEHHAEIRTAAPTFASVMHPPTEIGAPVPRPPQIGGSAFNGSTVGVSNGDPEGWYDGTGTQYGDPTARVDPIMIPPPQPPRDPASEKVEPPARRVVSKGPLNGVAIRRDQPPYPEIAKQTGVTGTVVVEVTVSEAGDVVSAHAISGHPLFTRTAEQSARNWKFSPTMLGGVPVKVVGTITFVFKRS
jgi:TonB family protein